MIRVMITGGAGFIGSNALDYFMLHPNYEVRCVIDKLTYAADAARVYQYPNIKFYKVDLATTHLKFIFDTAKPDVIINFAAESHVDNSIISGAGNEFVQSNIVSVIKLIEAIRAYNQTENKNILLLHVSTDEVLGDISLDSYAEYDEYMPMRPNNLYAATKAAAEHVINSMHHTYNDFNYAVVRATNNYGPNQHTEKFLPTVISCILQNKKIPIYGKGENVREWLYVDDFVSGIEAVVAKYIADPVQGIGQNHVYHFGSNVRITNLGVVTTLLNMMGKSYELISYVEDRLGHDRKYALDSSKARRELNWSATQDFERGLQIVIDNITQRLSTVPEESKND